jgi:hypothetical protein
VNTPSTIRGLAVSLAISVIIFSQPLLIAEPTATGANPQIECITPDGQFSKISRPHVVDPRSAASIIDDATLSCPLREGETTFVIALPRNASRDRFTFVNENAAASGELKIAVSDSYLPANSPNWTEVDGIVPFSHKRLFNLSILGVETKFVRLSFHVESSHDGLSAEKVTDIPAAFRSSALANAINSHFATLHSQRADLSATSGSLSVDSSVAISNN